MSTYVMYLPGGTKYRHFGLRLHLKEPGELADLGSPCAPKVACNREGTGSARSLTSKQFAHVKHGLVNVN